MIEIELDADDLERMRLHLRSLDADLKQFRTNVNEHIDQLQKRIHVIRMIAIGSKADFLLD